MRPESKEQLQQFMQRALKVLRSNYVKQVMENKGFSLNLSWKKGEEAQFTTNIPDEEKRDALLLTARMFVQKNDPVSFMRMAELDNDPGVSAEWKQMFQLIRDGLNGALDTPIQITVNGQNPTHREVFYTFLYGNYAHTEKKYVTTYEQWKLNPFMEFEFNSVVNVLLRAVSDLAYVTDLELRGKKIEVAKLTAPAEPKSQ